MLQDDDAYETDPAGDVETLLYAAMSVAATEGDGNKRVVVSKGGRVFVEYDLPKQELKDCINCFLSVIH